MSKTYLGSELSSRSSGHEILVPGKGEKTVVDEIKHKVTYLAKEHY